MGWQGKAACNGCSGITARNATEPAHHTQRVFELAWQCASTEHAYQRCKGSLRKEVVQAGCSDLEATHRVAGHPAIACPAVCTGAERPHAAATGSPPEAEPQQAIGSQPAAAPLTSPLVSALHVYVHSPPTQHHTPRRHRGVQVKPDQVRAEGIGTQRSTLCARGMHASTAWCKVPPISDRLRASHSGFFCCTCACTTTPAWSTGYRPLAVFGRHDLNKAVGGGPLGGAGV